MKKTRHGWRWTPEYKAWCEMKRRCYNPKCRGYKDYGHRGITVCKRWRESFPKFIKDMGPKPTSLHSIERKDNDGNYKPTNCYWALRHDQSRNRRNNIFVTVNGKRMVVRDAAEVCGLSYGMVRNRIWRGWTAQRAVSTPPKR